MCESMSRCFSVFKSSLGDHMRGLQVANERIIDVNFLNAMAAALVTLMHHDFFDKFVEHTRRKRFKGSVLLRHSEKAVDVDRLRSLFLNL